MSHRCCCALAALLGLAGLAAAADDSLTLLGPGRLLARIGLREADSTERYGWIYRPRGVPGPGFDGWTKVVYTGTTRRWRDANRNQRMEPDEVSTVPVLAWYRAFPNTIGLDGLDGSLIDDNGVWNVHQRGFGEWASGRAKLSPCALGDGGLSGPGEMGNYHVVAVRGPLRVSLHGVALVEALAEPGGGYATLSENELKRESWVDRDKLRELVARIEAGRGAALTELVRSLLSAFDEWDAARVARGPGLKGLFPTDLRRWWPQLAELPAGLRVKTPPRPANGYAHLTGEFAQTTGDGYAELQLSCVRLAADHNYADTPLLQARTYYRESLERMAGAQPKVQQQAIPLADESWLWVGRDNVELKARVCNVLLTLRSAGNSPLWKALAAKIVAKLVASLRPLETARPEPPKVDPPGPDLPVRLLLRQVDTNWRGAACDPVNRIAFEAKPPRGTKPSDLVLTVRAEGQGVPLPGTIVDTQLAQDRVRFFYSPPPATTRNFVAEVVATVRTPDGQTEERVVSLDITQPPLLFVHGVWSSAAAWVDAISPHADRFKALGFGVIDYFDYSTLNNQDPGQIARGELAQPGLADVIEGKDGLLSKLTADKLLCRRVDLVGHSMGGLISRAYIVGGGWQHVRRLVTVGTPHAGSPFAEWFRYFARARRPFRPQTTLAVPAAVQANAKWQAGYTNWTFKAFRWLVDTARTQQKLDPSFFVDGPAVDALAPGSAFLTALNAADGHDGEVGYCFIYGNRPLLPAAETWWTNEGLDMMTWKSNEVIYDTFFAHVTAQDTDGVVPVESARAAGLKLKAQRIPIELPADHVGLPKAAVGRVVECLTQ